MLKVNRCFIGRTICCFVCAIAFLGVAMYYRPQAREPKTTERPPDPIHTYTVVLPDNSPVLTRYKVYATREGLIGGTTASGRVIHTEDVFVALPSRKALNKWVCVRYQGKTIRAQVWDVGPWNTIDDYWNYEGVPAAAKGLRIGSMARYGSPKNKAGIDLSDGLWDQFGIKRGLGIVQVEWWFE